MPPRSSPHWFQRSARFGNRPAIVTREGATTYAALAALSDRVAAGLLDGRRDLREARVAFLVPPGPAYVATQWGIWKAGGIAVPLCAQHPPPEWEYAIGDSDPLWVVADGEAAARLRPVAEKLGRRFALAPELAISRSARLPAVAASRRAMMLYTSGTTGKPKGAVTTHANVRAQVLSLVKAWRWTRRDRILHPLPLHHIHGVVNALCCALWSGATCEMLPAFDAAEVWARLRSGRITLLMGVPTMYTRLAQAWEAAPPAERRAMSRACRRVRLMVCGSAALPVPVLDAWKRVSGHVLLERYGMTEIGMALSNPLRGKRRPGCVGRPLPAVRIRLADEKGRPARDGQPGEIQVKGPTVFLEYWRRPAETRKSFADGWFRTGDIATRARGIYRILGRSSTDIIKTGGYKVSALEIEQELLAHPAIAECAVVGLPDPEWGERVAAAVRLRPGKALDLAALREWSRARLAIYKVPSRLLAMDALPRNAMGKVLKPRVVEAFRAAV
jgi:malonyl-CoA/methylmalonyl-CoA synthetase